MSILKEQIRRSESEEIGNLLDDQLEAAEALACECRGSESALRSLGQKLPNIFAQVDARLDDGKYDIEQAKEIKYWLSLVVEMVGKMAMASKGDRYRAEGGTIFLKRAVQQVGKRRDASQQRISALSTSEGSSAPPSGHVTGIHPGGGIKAQRLAEGAAMAEQARADEAASAVGGVKQPAKKRRAKKTAKKTTKRRGS